MTASTTESIADPFRNALAALTAGDYARAERCLRAAIAHDDAVADYHAHLGVVLKLLGKTEERLACYRRAMALAPAEPSYPANLAAALCETGAPAEAEAAALTAIRLDPQRAESHFNLGVVKQHQQDWRAAADSFSRAAELKQATATDPPHPNHPALRFWHTAALAWTQAGEPVAAVSAFQAALRAHGPTATPARAGLLLDLADALETLCHREPAEAAVREALAIQPASRRAWNLLGHVRRAQGDYDGAQQAFEHLLTLDPGNAAALGNIGAVRHQRGDTAGAIRAFRHTLAIDPSLGVIRTNLGNVLTYAVDHGPPDVRAAFEDWDRQLAQPLRDPRPHANPRDPERRLRVGYVSPDFRKHAVAYFALPLLEHHDRTQVEVFCYYNHRQQDAWTARFKAGADHWREVTRLDDAQLAELIRADGIDLLIDLAGHTEGNRLLTFARKPAPVQATWMGYVTTTGLSAMDWRITHADADPPGSDDHYTETLYRLPGTLWCWRPLPDMPAVSPPPCRRTGHITFGSFNRFAKNGPAVLQAWAEILSRVPDSRLLIVVPEGESRRTLLAVMAGRGIAPERITTCAKLDHAAFWQRHGEVDIALDPFPFGGGTTTCETLWLGVPLVTCTGRDGGDFAPRFAREMETAYRTMWRRWCAERAFAEADALFQRGNAQRAAGDQEGAIACYRRALAEAPEQAMIHNNLGNALKDSGRLEAAVAAYRDARRLDPESAMIHNNLGSALRELQQPDAAAQCFAAAVERAPAFLIAWRNLAATHLALNRYPEAVAAYRAAIRIAPEISELHRFLAIVLRRQGQLDEARHALETAVRLDPQDAEQLNDLGTLYQELGEPETALASLQQALRLKPDSAEILTNLGLVCRDMQRHHEALDHYRRALALRPELAETYNNLALCRQDLGQWSAAEQDFRQALALKPDFAIAQANLGSLLKDLGRYAEALACFQAALHSDPESLTAWNNRLFCLNLMEAADPSSMPAAAREFGARLRRTPPPDAALDPLPARTADPARPQRIGWVSGDLRVHPVGYFLDRVLAELQRRHPDLQHVAYFNHGRPDALSARLQRRCTAWHAVMGWSDAQLARHIRADGIDILIDLAGHTAHNRLPVFAWKPAPVQVTWLGYFATTGVAEIDYLIADPWTLPESEEAHFTEQIWRLPETRLCFSPPTEDIPVNPLPALTQGYITFGCFNNLAKLNDAVVAAWARILHALPTSRLILKTKQLADAAVRDATLARFAAHGLAPERLTLEGPTPRADYLAAYHRLDIALDPFPYPGGATTVEALWMGVPVLTLAGERFLSRQGVGLLMNAGLPEWVASDADDYVARALSLAKDLPSLAALRRRLRAQLLASPVCDASRFADHLAAALRGMWQCRRREASPATPHARRSGRLDDSAQRAPVTIPMSDHCLDRDPYA